MNIIKDLLAENDRIYAEECALAEIAEYYGTEKQLRQLQEECAELIQAVSKCCRYPDEGYETHLMEEICDVLICIDQIQLNEPEWQWSLLESFRKAKIYREMKRTMERQVKPMNRVRAIEQLQDLIKDREAFLIGGGDAGDEIFRKDIAALERAIFALQHEKIGS